jgi:metallophosphoesterase superfamily enzyme
MTGSLGEFADAEAAKTDGQRGRQVIGKLADVLAKQGIAPEDIGRVHRLSLGTWQGFYANRDGEGHTTVDLERAGIVLSPKWAEGPEWPVVQQAAPCRVAPSKLRPRTPDGWERAAILPDIQFGYRLLRDDDGSPYLDPFHDEQALAVALAVTRVIRPDKVIILGDGFDFAGQSKFVQEQAWASTTQASIDRGHRFLAELRAVAPHAQIVFLEGNHDLRLARSIQINAAASHGLQQANMPASWPVLTVPHLCRFDELGVEYVSGYPAGRFWVNDNLCCIHGHKVRSSGSTAAAVIDDERVSTIFGHIHRLELQHKTRHTRAGAKQSFAASPGCLCRIDGAVPSAKGGVDLLGRPLVSYENWQQGMAVVTYEPGDGRFGLELVPIHFGRAVFRGRLYESGLA